MLNDEHQSKKPVREGRNNQQGIIYLIEEVVRVFYQIGTAGNRHNLNGRAMNDHQQEGDQM